MAEVGLQAEVREGRGKGPARRLRATGKVPGTVYGRGAEAIAVAVDARLLKQTLSTDAGVNVLIDLKIGSDTHLTLARALDKDPLRGDILHVDFLKISRDEKIIVDVPVHIGGESHGVKEGGVIEHHLWQIHVECLPGNVPGSIDVDVSALGIGDSLYVRDITAPDGVTFLTPDDEIVVSCVVPQLLKVEAELGEVAAVAEGEVAPVAEGAPAEGEAKGEAKPTEGEAKPTKG